MDDLQQFIDDVVGAFAGAVLILFLLLVWLLSNGSGPTLVNEPCAPAKPVIVNGEKVGCTNDPYHMSGPIPDWHPDDML